MRRLPNQPHTSSLNLVDIARQMEQLTEEEVLVLTVDDDPLLLADIEAWCHRHSHSVEFSRSADGTRLRITPHKGERYSSPLST